MLVYVYLIKKKSLYDVYLCPQKEVIDVYQIKLNADISNPTNTLMTSLHDVCLCRINEINS